MLDTVPFTMCCYRSLDKAKGDRDDDNHVEANDDDDDDDDVGLNDYDNNDDDGNDNEENIYDDFSQPGLAPNGSCLLL